MTPPAVTRLAEELYEAVRPVAEESQQREIVPWARASKDRKAYWHALARHVLKRERRARGRTLCYVATTLKRDDEWLSCKHTLKMAKRLVAAKNLAEPWKHHVARVVLVARRRRAR